MTKVQMPKNQSNGRPDPKPPKRRQPNRRSPDGHPNITLHHRAGRWLTEPKLEHQTVLRALEIANLAFKRVVSVDELAKALNNKEREQLEAKYAKDLGQTLSKILGLLSRRGLVFSPGKIGKRSYYGTKSALDAKTAVLPTEQSRRRRVLELVQQTVNILGRAVRIGDVIEHAGASLDIGDITPITITRDMLSLKETGELRLTGTIRGDGKGINLYLPAELDPNAFKVSGPLTWLEAVAQIFNELWSARANQAAANKRTPRPLSTGDIRAHLAASGQYAERLTDPQTLVDAMQNLASTKKPLIRRVKRSGQKAMLWAPANVPDTDLDIGDAYVTDSERICEAVRRASHALGRPVNLRDVKDEIERDPALRPAGSYDLFKMLSDLSREMVNAGGGMREKRASQQVHRIGKIKDESYYFTDKSPEAYAYVKFRRLEMRWSAMRNDEQLNALETCSLPSVAIGRAMLVATDTRNILKELNQIITGGHLTGAPQREAKELREYVNEILNRANEWLKQRVKGKQEIPIINPAIPGWTAEELLRVIKPLYPRARDIQTPSKLIPLIGDAIRRVPNPDFKNRFSKNPRMAAEYLYDRTDALLYIAKEWGGTECCLQSTLAGNELGRLRDPRFVLPALALKDFNARLAAVACLAFLWSDQGTKELRSIAVNDHDPGIRQSALWGYGFAGGSDARDLLKVCSEGDIDVRVRSFAKEVLNSSEESWWAL
ncbi:MAG TPA: hypothetical protein VF658_21205 [Pyrinomonadaceae bacterium]